MTYLKTLIALTTLALITACAGGVTINPVVNNNNGPTTATCTANPFATGCTTTPTQQATFCRDKSKITDTKDTDCAPTVIRLCGENPFETGLCTEPTPTEAEAFCSDDNKSTATKANDCIPTISRVCGENPFEAGLCFDDNTYEPTRVQIRATCTNADGASPPRHALCPDIVVTECTADPFLAVCRLGTAGADDGTYGLERAKQIAATCPNNVHDIRCHGEEPYETTRQGILSNCETNVGTGNACPANVVMQVCIGNPYNTVLCNDPAIDYTTQRLIRLNECKANNGLDGCAAAAATTCPANPFQAVLCFIDTTYEGDRTTQTQNCRDGVTDAPNCPDVLIAVCNADKFDTHCMGATDYIDAQRNECALATATTAQCNGVFAAALAGCLADPFSVACDTEATFTASRDSVRTSRFGFCETDQTNDARCAGYRTCSDADFAPITCGTDFNSARMMFCGTTANAFDSLCITNNLADTGAQMAYCMVTAQAFDDGCVGGLKNAAAQLAFCKLSTSDPFGTNCGGTAFKEARVEFCIAKPTTIACDTDLHGEDLMYVADPCLTNDCVDLADLPTTYPTTPAENDPVGTTFASGFLRVTLNPLAEGTPLLKPSGTENSTIDLTPFPTGTVVREEGLRFGRRGGLGSIDDDGFVNFRLLKAGAGGESTRSSVHSAILPTTSLGAPLASPPMTALWPGHYYPTRGGIRPANFYITFDTSLNTGAINFANIAGDGIGAGDTRQDFVKSLLLTLTAAFDANGVITGTVSQLGDFLIGAPILGLIGTEGLVAAASSGAGAAGFTATNPDGGAAPVLDPCIAGLVADNCVNTAAWLASFEGGNALPTTPDATTRVNQFLQATATGFASGANAGIRQSFGSPQTDIAIKTRTFANTDTATGGFAYFGGELYSGEAGSETGTRTYFYYAGVLAGTNLGAPITAPIISARWTGQIRADSTDNNGVLTANPAAGFGLNITFDGAEGTMKSIFEVGVGFYYEMDGTFNDKGIIEGTVALGYSTTGTGDNRVLATSHTFYSPGTLRGIIGQNGAVGVFHSDNANVATKYRFSGGFVVTPPTN